MQPDNVSTQYITSSPQCHENCSKIHPSQKTHRTISTLDLESQIEQILNQNYDKWLGLFEKLQNSLQDLTQNITQYLNDLQSTFNEYRNIIILNQHKLPQKDQKALATAVGKVTHFSYDKITCDQVERIHKAISQNSKKQQLALNKQFEKVQQKIGDELLQILKKNFPTVNKKNPQKTMDSEQISNKIKEIMQQQIQKIKPIINEQLSKAKPTTANVQNQEKNLHKTDIWEQMTAQNQKQSSQYNTHKKLEQSHHNQKSTYTKSKFQDTKSTTNCSHRPCVETCKLQYQIGKVTCNHDPYVKICNIKNKLGKFNCIAKVLWFIKKEMKFDNKICTRFLAGDETGAAIFMFQHSNLLQIGNTIEIKSAQISNYNHEQQVQFTPNSKISLSKINISQIGSFRLSPIANNTINQKRTQITNLFAPKKTNLVSTYKKVKIVNIKSGQKGYWVDGKVLEIISTKNPKKIFTLSDETGVIFCEIPAAFNKNVKQGVFVRLQYFDAIISNGYIFLKMSAKGRIIIDGQ